MKINPLLLADFYKVAHYAQYPKGTKFVYSNFTARKSRLEGVDSVVFFGLQYFLKEYLQNYFNENFFKQKRNKAVLEYKRILDCSLGDDTIDMEHIYALYDLGYLPLEIRALPEGTSVPIRVPMLTIINTKPEFYWLTNYIESIMSAILWQPITSATIAKRYRSVLDDWAEKTSDIPEFVDWQGHDFSFRGMGGLEAAMISGAGHLLSFTGTDTIPAIWFLEKFYDANVEKELVGGSVAATEHSVMSAAGHGNEFELFERLITEIYPKGIVSVVSDTWNLWEVLTDYLPRLKDKILSRDGKLVIRPDSGDPVDIICGTAQNIKRFDTIENAKGYYQNNVGYADHNKFRIDDKYFQVLPHRGEEFKYNEIEHDCICKGVIELLWDTFGGTVNSKGYKQLDPHIGAIYGDSITIERANEICKRLEAKGFASTNIVFGIGSFTYQYNTRDTFGMAMKATWVNVNGEGREIFKDPVTDDGTKKSAKGLIKVKRNEKGKLELIDQVSYDEAIYDTELELVFQNGKIVKEFSLQEIRNNVKR